MVLYIFLSRVYAIFDDMQEKKVLMRKEEINRTDAFNFVVCRCLINCEYVKKGSKAPWARLFFYSSTGLIEERIHPNVPKNVLLMPNSTAQCNAGKLVL